MRAFVIGARIWTAVALWINAYIHFVLAIPFDSVVGPLISQGNLFRIQAVVNIVAGILILVLPRWWSGLFAAAVGAGGLLLLVLSVYIPLDLSTLGLPVIFEPIWYQDKIVAAVTQAFAVIGGLIVAARTRPQTARKPT